MKAFSMFIIWILFVIKPTEAADVHFYVSPAGNDNNNGTSDKFPFKTIQKALSWTPHTADGNNYTYIELMAGYYEMSTALNLVKPNLVMRSYKHQNVHFVGGKRISSSSFKPVTDAADLAKLPTTARQHVKIVSLPSVGITNYGGLGKYGTFSRWNAPLEISYNGQVLALPMWPKQGFLDIVKVPDVHGLTFQYNSPETHSWHTEADPWIYGYVEHSWSDKAVKVAALDTNKQTVTIKDHITSTIQPGHWNSSARTSVGSGGYFRFINILSALSQPGEFYVDRTNGKLYLWPPTTDSNVHANDVVIASLADNCIQMDSRSKNVKLQDFTIESCRRNGVHLVGTNNVQITNMEVKNTGTDGIYAQGDNRNFLVAKCVIHDTTGGLMVQGGVRKTLESSGSIFENNEIYRFSRLGEVGYVGIQATGVGHIIRFNNIHTSNSMALYYQGNDILMEHNLVYDICQEKYFCSCVLATHDLTARGNIIRSNIIHGCSGKKNSEIKAIHLDDHSSSTSITQNVFYNNGIDVYIAGGRHNEVSENLLYGANIASLKIDVRTKLSSSNNNNLHAVPYTSNEWRLRYPELADIDKHNPALPIGNSMVKNIVFSKDGTRFLAGSGSSNVNPDYYNITKVGVSTGPGDHNDVSAGDYRIRCDLGKWANAENVPQFPSPNDVGPKYEPGPAYLHRGRRHVVTLHNTHSPCTTQAPATDTPMPSYLPDGTGTHVHVNVSNEGCWLKVSKCGNHTTAVGTYRDMYGERYHHAGESEEMCFQRAAEQWRFCGSNPRETVAAIYGPTGATSYGGGDCVVAQYGCPKHGGPTDGRVYGYNNGTMYADYYSMTHRNSSTNESACLARALDIWHYCGSNRNHPITMIFKPTGATRTAGAGCWIKSLKCIKHPEMKPVFYDAWGATNRLTDKIEATCLDQAKYYWDWCGYDPKYPVTATFRPTTKSFTYP